ncbi:hypothetical protein CLAIMM_14730 [Cladophialophora immunda]|nr:hypothetical protein CLAIMM_14730 [Cladophialophora immunda]
MTPHQINKALAITKARRESPATVPTHPTVAAAVLPELPNEILAKVIELLYDDRPEYVQIFRQTCKKIYEACEPAYWQYFHSGTPDRSERLELMLKSRRERYDLVKMFAVNLDYAPAAVNRTERIVWCLPKLQRLRALHICETPCLGEEYHVHNDSFFTALNGALVSGSFAELRECTLSGRIPHTVLIAPILRAPKLTTLRVAFPLLDDLDDSLPPPKSTPLQHLTLFTDPYMDWQISLSILRMPKALETLAFDDSRTWTVGKSGRGILEYLIPYLALHQPELKTLKLYANKKWCFWKPENAGTLDFTPLTKLKELSFSNHEKCPINCFVSLPIGLETLRLNSPVSLTELTEKLTTVPYFTSPAHLVIDQDYRLYQAEETEEWRRSQEQFDIKKLMARLPCQTITILERDDHTERRVQATRTNANPGIDGSNPFEVQEDTRRTPPCSSGSGFNPTWGCSPNDLSIFHCCYFRQNDDNSWVLRYYR